MRSQLLCLLLFTLCMTAVSADSLYEKLSKMKRNGIITLSDSQYQEYVLTNKRDFDAFILYSVASSRYHCPTCVQMNNELQLVVSTFEKMEDTPRVLFLRVLHENSPRVFKYHNFDGIPNLVYIPRTLHVNKVLPPDNFMSQNIEGALRAEHITSFIRSKIAFSIPITRFPWVQVIIGCTFVFGLPIAAYIYLFKAETVYKWFGYKQIYLVLCLLVYALAVSGIIYDIIKEPPFIYCTERGCSMFSNSSQGQFVLEGMVTGLMNLCCCFVVIYLIKMAVTTEHSEGENISTCIFGFLALYLAYIFCYIIKNPWYIGVLHPKGN